MDLHDLFTHDTGEWPVVTEEQLAAYATSEVLPDEGYRATTMWESFPGLMPFA